MYFLSFLGLPTVWLVSVSDYFYCYWQIAILSKVVGLAGLLPPSSHTTVRAVPHTAVHVNTGTAVAVPAVI
jgi:hypothetical protein